MCRPSSRLFVLALLLAAPLAGQSSEYTAPGSLGSRPADEREALRAAVDEARWRLGPIRIEPWAALDEIA
jgi:hypothetical protein